MFANIASTILVPMLAARNGGIWWKWFILTLGIGAFAWLPFIIFYNQRRNTGNN
jgi:hypothetical protein